MEQSMQVAPRKRAFARRGAVALALVALVVLAVVFFLVRGDDSSLEPGIPKELSADELADLESDAGGPVYWAGPMEGTKLEVTKTSQGHVFVRYLPEAAPIGDNKPQYTTVSTYPQQGALRAVGRAGRRRGMVTSRVAGGGVATWSRARPTSVYVGLPNSDRLVEVFNPDAKIARELAVSGRIQPAS